MGCNELIESRHVHDYVSCNCGNIAVDGGKEYLRRTFASAMFLADISKDSDNPNIGFNKIPPMNKKSVWHSLELSKELKADLEEWMDS